MNFENYNKIYQELLEDNGDLNSNYLMNKYKISNEDELINILNQIKKNEYISSENSTIVRLLDELDENIDMLDINQIIDVKEKVMDINVSSNFNDTAEEEQTHKEAPLNETSPETKINTKSNYKKLFQNVDFSKIKDFFPNNKTILYSSAGIASALLIAIIFTYTNQNTENIALEDSDIITQESVVETKENPEELVQLAKEIDKIETASNNTINTDQTEENLNNIVAVEEDASKKAFEVDPRETTPKESITLNSLDDINNYITQLKFENGKLLFKDHLYAENENLFGYKIYKLTSVYVKFEDEKNQIRKRFLLNN